MKASVTIHPIWVLLTETKGRTFGPLIEKIRKLRAIGYPLVLVETRSTGMYVRDPENDQVHFAPYTYLSIATEYPDEQRAAPIIALRGLRR